VPAPSTHVCCGWFFHLSEGRQACDDACLRILQASGLHSGSLVPSPRAYPLHVYPQARIIGRHGRLCYQRHRAHTSS
jgi:hypothetical protein